MKFYIWVFFENLSEKIQVLLKFDKNNGYITWRPIFIFFTISRSTILRLRNVADKSWREILNTYLMFNNSPPPRLPKTVPLWDNVEKYCRAVQATNDNMALTPKATNTLSEYVILVFHCQQWLHERASVLCYTHIVCLVDFVVGRDSVVGLATGYGSEVRGSNSGGGKIYLTRRDGPWSQPNLLYNAYLVSFQGGIAAGAWRWPLSTI
jgi:hypothetical protein